MDKSKIIVLVDIKLSCNFWFFSCPGRLEDDQEGAIHQK